MGDVLAQQWSRCLVQWQALLQQMLGNKAAPKAAKKGKGKKDGEDAPKPSARDKKS